MNNDAQVDAELLRADTLKAAGRLAEAAALCAEICRAHPNHAPARLLHGRLAWDMQQPDLALVCFTRAAELDPPSPLPWNELAETYFALGRLEEADEALRESLARAPHQPDPYIKRALVSLRAKDRDQAKEFCRQVLEFEPDYVGAHQLLGSFAWQDGDLEATAHHTAAARQGSSPGPDPYGQLAWSLFALGRTGEIEVQVPAASDGQLFIEVMVQAIAAWQDDQPELCHRLLIRAGRVFQKLEEAPNKGVFAPFLILLEALLQCREAEPELYQGAPGHGEPEPGEAEPGETEPGETEPGEPADVIHALGDDHCLSAAHLTVGLGERAYRIRPCLVVGCRAQHLAERQARPERSAFAVALDRLADGASVLVSLGELDCRYAAGMLPGLRDKPEHEADAAVEALVRAYVAVVIEMTEGRGFRLLFMSPPARNLSLRKIPSTDRTLFTRIVARFAAALGEIAREQDLPFLDLHAVTLDPHGQVRADLFSDSHHVRPQAILEAFERMDA